MVCTIPCYRTLLSFIIPVILLLVCYKPLHAQIKAPSIDSVQVDVTEPFRNLLNIKPSLRILGGYTAYQFNYRSFIDTPFAESNILQHQVNGRLQLMLADMFPLEVNYWIRRSNSQFFKNTADVQLAFSGAGFRNNIQGAIRSRLLAIMPVIHDSLLQKAYSLKQLDLNKLENELRSTFYPQKLAEAREMLTNPGYTWDATSPDSVGMKINDSVKKAATQFLELYEQFRLRYDSVKGQTDSLKKLYEANRQKVNQYKQLVNGKWDELQSARQWRNKMQEYGLGDIEIPAKYRWLLGIRQFSLGRSPLNYSELTAKNVSVNGINVEYNSWYYLALTAGLVNYQFRDFVVSGQRRQPQYLYMVRAGIGRVEKNYFILSAFRGQKQLFRQGTAGRSAIGITGISAETRWAVNRQTWIKAEVATSSAPDIRTSPVGSKSRFTFSDRNNQAVALHLYSYVPFTGSRIEAMFKRTGANYQSFSSYTTNAAMESWYIKAEQNFFNRKLRIAGALRKNEFQNPYIVQDYKSNTVFKSITASFRMRKLPVITIGYQPMSQFTRVDDVVVESRFQSMNATVYYDYKIHQLRMATTAMLNKFYNNNNDTGFIYYDATNSYLAQQFFFQSFTAQVGGSYTKNAHYRFQVLDGSITPIIPKWGTVTLGVKINNLNRSSIKAGGYVKTNIRVFKNDRLFISYEHGYLPGNYGNLVRNEMGMVQFIKTFNFR